MQNSLTVDPAMNPGPIGKSNLANTERLGFIRKVLGIFSTQMVFTVIVLTAFISSQYLQNFMVKNVILLYISIVVNIVTFCMIACSRNMARSVPINYILLTIFTVSEAYMLATVALTYTASSIIQAGILTAAMTIGLVIYALYTKTDFTFCGAFFFVFLLILVSSSVLFFIYGNLIGNFLYNVLGVSLASLYIIYDVQIIFEGKHKRCMKLSSEEYVYAAMVLYMDVIYLFLKILKAMGSKK